MRRSSLFIAVFLLFLGACSTHDKILKSSDINFKLTKANEYYDQKKWAKANDLYERLMPVFRGSKNFEELYYRYAYTFYNMRDYLSASYQFKNFLDLFPKSTRGEEIEFMYATSLYKMSPKYTLDQTNTKKAIEVLQTFINNHPNSKNVTLANNYIDVARAKLERKQKEAALLYYGMQEYKAASVAFQSMIRAFPESRESDYYQYMAIQSFYQYACRSNRSKQEERYAEALAAYHDLKDFYPDSKYIQEAEPLIRSAEAKIKQLRNDHN